MRRTGDLKLMQQLNRSIILNTIRESGPISRSQVAQKIRVSPTTVTSAVGELLEQSLVKEVGSGSSNGGRRPVMLAFNPESRFVISVVIDSLELSIGKVNLAIDVKKKVHHAIPNDGRFLELLVEKLQLFIDEEEDLKDCEGISVIVQGIVDSEQGIIQHNNRLDLYDLPLRDILEERFSIKCYVENDTNGLLLAEKYLGKLQGDSDLLYVAIGDGVGASFFTNGALTRGANGGAGEFGHTSVNANGLPCKCGNRGCIENYISWRAIEARLKEDLAKEKLVYSSQDSVKPEVFCERLRKGEPVAAAIYKDVLEYSTVGIVNLVNIYNPSFVHLGGSLPYLLPEFVKELSEKVKQRSLSSLSNNLVIQGASFGPDAGIKGAATVLLHDFFEFSL
ncbi:ROK family transcriptional regulator [Shouchella shacheensis]|uniref:ROK family transcriptional regulator n=1 Tax=Shouchella shacheensis TaxID=1649580 RepID=UPI0007403028|nr:ROK family transcriptional regulator [Shouchella shacheensis]